MMAFSNADLKRLRARVNDPDGDDGLKDVFAADVLRLILRLEAAEDVASFADKAPITLLDRWHRMMGI